MVMSYRVKLNVFEGPFDLLVYLIEHARMSIYDIRISEITKQYVEYVHQMQEANVNLASEFLLLASELLEIKSRMLLPRINTEENIEDRYEDPRTELVEKLKEYKKYKAIASMLEERLEESAASQEKPQEDLTEYTNEQDEYLVLDSPSFKKAFEDFLQRKKKLDEIRAHHVRTGKQRMTTEIRISNIKDFFKEIPAGERRNFMELIEKKEDKYDISVTFASVLQMMKEKRLGAEQRRLFGDIELYATENLMDDVVPDETPEEVVNGEQDN